MAATEAKDTAETILAQLGQNFTVPAVDLAGSKFQLPSQTNNPLYAPVLQLDLDALTSGKVDGSGAFDRLMSSQKAHLKEQYDKGLITGDQYTKAYIELTSVAMSTALQMLLSKDQTYFQNLLVQAQARRAEVEAVTAMVQLETAKQQLAGAKFQADTLRAQYVLTMMQVASEDAKYGLAMIQSDLVREQIEAARAQTLDTRTDGTTVVGSIGKQKALYTQQIDSYKKDAEYKVGKMYLDGWITQKTIDEGLTAPSQLTNAQIDSILTKLRANLNLS